MPTVVILRYPFVRVVLSSPRPGMLRMETMRGVLRLESAALSLLLRQPYLVLRRLPLPTHSRLTTRTKECISV